MLRRIQPQKFMDMEVKKSYSYPMTSSNHSVISMIGSIERERERMVEGPNFICALGMYEKVLD